MHRLDWTEIKILATSVSASLFINTDILIRFFVPLLSAWAWFLLKPVLENFRNRKKKKDK